MYVARWILLPLVIVSILIASSPQMRAVTGQAWDDARPGVVQVMDGVCNHSELRYRERFS